MEFAAILAQLRLDVSQIEEPVDLGLGLARDALVVLENTVLVDLVALLHRPCPQGHVVRLGAGEVLERGAVALLWHDAQIHLQAGAQEDGGAGLALGDHGVHVLVLNKVLDNGHAVLANSQDVDITHGLLAAAVAARHLHPRDAVQRAQVIDQRLNERLGDVQARPRLRLAGLRQIRQDLLLGLRAEAVKLADAALLCRNLQLIEVGDVQILVERLHPLRPQAFDLEQLQQRARRTLFDLLQFAQAACLHHLLDFCRQLLTDAGQRRQIVAGRHQVAHVARMLGDGARPIAISAHAKAVRAFDLQQIGQIIEHRCDLCVLNRHGSSYQQIKQISVDLV